MIADRWPLYGLVLRTPRLELRLPDPERLSQLADLAAAGVHDPAVQPFLAEWTDAPPDGRAEFATSGAFADNHASYAVSRRLGYAEDGISRHLIRGVPVAGRRLWLDARPGRLRAGFRSGSRASNRAARCSGSRSDRRGGSSAG